MSATVIASDASARGFFGKDLTVAESRIVAVSAAVCAAILAAILQRMWTSGWGAFALGGMAMLATIAIRNARKPIAGLGILSTIWFVALSVAFEDARVLLAGFAALAIALILIALEQRRALRHAALHAAFRDALWRVTGLIAAAIAALAAVDRIERSAFEASFDTPLEGLASSAGILAGVLVLIALAIGVWSLPRIAAKQMREGAILPAAVSDTLWFGALTSAVAIVFDVRAMSVTGTFSEALGRGCWIAVASVFAFAAARLGVSSAVDTDIQALWIIVLGDATSNRKLRRHAAVLAARWTNGPVTIVAAPDLAPSWSGAHLRLAQLRGEAEVLFPQRPIHFADWVDTLPPRARWQALPVRELYADAALWPELFEAHLDANALIVAVGEKEPGDGVIDGLRAFLPTARTDFHLPVIETARLAARWPGVEIYPIVGAGRKSVITKVLLAVLTIGVVVGAFAYFQRERSSFEQIDFTFQRQNGVIVVKSVDPGSSAEQAGLRADDNILLIGGTPTTEVERLWKTLQRVGTPVQMVIARGGEMLTIIYRLPEPKVDFTSPILGFVGLLYLALSLFTLMRGKAGDLRIDDWIATNGKGRDTVTGLRLVLIAHAKEDADFAQALVSKLRGAVDARGKIIRTATIVVGASGGILEKAWRRTGAPWRRGVMLRRIRLASQGRWWEFLATILSFGVNADYDLLLIEQGLAEPVTEEDVLAKVGRDGVRFATRVIGVLWPGLPFPSQLPESAYSGFIHRIPDTDSEDQLVHVARRYLALEFEPSAPVTQPQPPPIPEGGRRRPSAFLSYPREQRELVEALASRLREMCDVMTDLDFDAGESVAKELERMISNADVIIPIISRETIKSDWAWRQLELAAAQQKPVLPIVIGQVRLPAFIAAVPSNTDAYGDVLDLTADLAGAELAWDITIANINAALAKLTI